jgi:UDP-N-acetylmuramyl tripeptide synthase
MKSFPPRRLPAGFQEFISQSSRTILWQDDFEYLGLSHNPSYSVQDPANPTINTLTLAGLYNRLDAWLAIQAVHTLTDKPTPELVAHMNEFPGSQRRMEEITANLFTDYAHTPEKIRGAMSVATKWQHTNNRPLVVVYEPLTNRRQHYMMMTTKIVLRGQRKCTGCQAIWRAKTLINVSFRLKSLSAICRTLPLLSQQT